MTIDESIAYIKSIHKKEHYDSFGGGDWCIRCKENWPCSIIVLVELWEKRGELIESK